jgi:hypothetical protein
VKRLQKICLNEDLLLINIWMQQHMVDRHYSLNLKPWSARTLYVYAHADLAQKYSNTNKRNFCLQVVLPGRKCFSCPEYIYIYIYRERVLPCLEYE